MELINETVNLTQTVLSGKTQTLAEGDIIVPDIKPDILKLLQVDAVSNITDKEVGDGGVSLYGTVDLKVLYIPDSENDRVKSIITAFDFQDRIENRKISPNSVAMVNTNVERVEFTLINSRKLRIKAVVGIEYEILDIGEVQMAVDIDDCDNVEMQKETLLLQSCADLSEHVFNIEESIEVPTGQGSIKELLKLDTSVSDTEYKAISTKVIAKGNVNVSVLYNNTDGEIEYCEAQLPFTEVLEGALINEECVCDIDYFIKEGEVTIDEDSDGDLRVINVNLEVNVQLRASNSRECEIIKDCYVPFSRINVEKETKTLDEVISKPSLQNTVRETIETGDKFPAISGVYNVIAKPIIKKVTPNSNKILCEGYIETCVLYLSDSNENPIYSLKKDIPFSYMMDAETEIKDYKIQIKPEIKHIGYNLNAAGEVEIRCILLLSANVIKSTDIEIITEIEETEDARNVQNGIVIYFVQPGDTLWSIAKKYGVGQNAVMEFNDLKDDKLRTGERLIIPGK